MIDSRKVDEIKKHIGIPKYFDAIIIPEMEGYYSDYTVDFESRPVVKCPLHGEDTPSLRWYEDTNTFYCFGCRAGGDIINLHRLFVNAINGDSPTFEEAVDFLYDFFIKGKESSHILTKGKASKTNKKDTKVSSNTDMLRLSSYIKDLESTLMIDNSIDTERKKEVYWAIDNVHMLVGLNILNALDGISYIRDVVSNGTRGLKEKIT